MPLKLAEKQLTLPFKGELAPPVTDEERRLRKLEELKEKYLQAELLANRLFHQIRALSGEGTRVILPNPGKKPTKKPTKRAAKKPTKKPTKRAAKKP